MPPKKKKTQSQPEPDESWEIANILFKERRKLLGYTENDPRLYHPDPVEITALAPELPPVERPQSIIQGTYSVKEAAKILNLSLVTVYRLIERGKIRCLQSVRHKRIPKTEMDRYMKADLG